MKMKTITLEIPDCMRIGQHFENFKHWFKINGMSVSDDIFYLSDEDFEVMHKKYLKDIGRD